MFRVLYLLLLMERSTIGEIWYEFGELVREVNVGAILKITAALFTHLLDSLQSQAFGYYGPENQVFDNRSG